MDADVFSQKIVGDQYNKTFVSIKVNAERSWGVEFARAFKISAYPTYLFFSPEGNVVLIEVGFKPLNHFLMMHKYAIENINKKISLESLNVDLNLLSNKELAQHIQALSPFKTTNSLLIEKYLEVLPEDSLYNPSTLRLVSTNYRGLMPVEGRAFKVLYRAYQKYPIKSGELQSPWNTLRSRYINAIEQAGADSDSLALVNIIESNSKLEESEEIKNRERDYLQCRYYYFQGNYKMFQLAMRKFYYNHIHQTSADFLYKTDSLRFDSALKIKYAQNVDLNKTSKIIKENFRLIFKSESFRLYDEFLSLIFLYSLLPQNDDLEINKWLLTTQDLYRNNPVYVSEQMINRGTKMVAQFPK